MFAEKEGRRPAENKHRCLQRQHQERGAGRWRRERELTGHHIHVSRSNKTNAPLGLRCWLGWKVAWWRILAPCWMSHSIFSRVPPRLIPGGSLGDRHTWPWGSWKNTHFKGGGLRLFYFLSVTWALPPAKLFVHQNLFSFKTFRLWYVPENFHVEVTVCQAHRETPQKAISAVTAANGRSESYRLAQVTEYKFMPHFSDFYLWKTHVFLRRSTIMHYSELVCRKKNPYKAFLVSTWHTVKEIPGCEYFCEARHGRHCLQLF